MSLPGQTPPRPAPTKYATPLGTRWDKEIAAAGGVSAFDLPSDPKNIGPWIMGECIGKGASGRVKLARHKDTEQLAAVKILPLDPVFNSRASLATQKAKSEKQRLGIDREITMMKLMNHPNIMRIYDVFEGTKELFLVLEYVEGGELFDYLVNRGRLSSMEAFVYFRQIIHGLNYAHTFSIIHRDLKPENILISSLSPTVIKIADWGMAAFAPPTLHLETSCGSPHYASPEIVNGEKYQGTATDIWSCGVILFALLTGRLPFDDKNVRHLLGKVKAGKYDMPTWIDPQAQDLLRRMIVVDVKKRITIPEILAHPWLTASRSQAMPKQLGYRPVKLDSPPLPPSPSDLAKPIDDPAEIDDELLASLQIIWGRHAEPSGANIRRDLCSPAGEGVHAKAFYFLLGRYREETTAARKGDVGEDDSRLKYRSMGSFNLGWELDAKLLGASLVLDAENQILGHRQSRRLSAVPRQLSLVREFSATTQPRAHSPAGPRSQTPDPTIRKKHLSDEHDNHSRGSVFLDPESDIFVPSFNATRGRPAHHREQTNTTRPRAATSTSSNAPDVQLTRPSHPARRTASHRASRRPAPLEVHSDFGIPQKQQARVLQRTSTRASEVPELDPDPLFDMDMGHVPASPVPTRLTIAAQSEMLRKARQDDITKATKRMTLAKHPNSSISPAPHRAIAQVLKSNHEGKENRSLDEDWSYISGSGDSPGVKSKETNAPPSRKSLFFDVRKEKAKSRPPPLDFSPTLNRQRSALSIVASPTASPSPTTSPSAYGRVASPVVGEFKGWFSNLFSWKSQAHSLSGSGLLYSPEGLDETRRRLLRFLQDLGIEVEVEESVLKCKIEDSNPAVVLRLGSVRPLRFRIELNDRNIPSGMRTVPSVMNRRHTALKSPVLSSAPTSDSAADSAKTAIVLVQEKGSMTTYKVIWKRLKDAYTDHSLATHPSQCRSPVMGPVTPMMEQMAFST